jgi:hypothetical protein
MKQLHILGTIFGASSCISCFVITLFILLYGTIMIDEPNLSILFIELLVAFAGTIINSYIFVKNIQNRV